MQSRIEVNRNGIVIILGVTGAVVIIASMLIFPHIWAAAFYVTAGIAGLAITYVAVMYGSDMYHTLTMQHYERIEKKMSMPVMKFNRTEGIFDLTTGQIIIAPQLGSGNGRIAGDPNVIEGDAIYVLEDILADGKHFLIEGGTNAGKTTLAKTLVAMLGANGAVICDPHSAFNDWPESWSVHDSYQHIGMQFERSFDEMVERYQQVKAKLLRKEDLKQHILVIDELPSVMEELKNQGHPVDKWLRRLAREARKAKIMIVGMCEAVNVKDLLTEGRSTVKQNFVRLQLDAANRGTIVALYPNGDTKTVRWHPAPMLPDVTVPLELMSGTIVQDELVENPLDREIRTIIELWDEGDSVSAISRKVYGGDGGNQLKKVRQMLIQGNRNPVR